MNKNIHDIIIALLFIASFMVIGYLMYLGIEFLINFFIVNM